MLAAFCLLGSPLAIRACLANLEGLELLARFFDWVNWLWACYLALFLELAKLPLDRLRALELQALELADLVRLLGLELAELGFDLLLGEAAFALPPLAFSGPRCFLALFLVRRFLASLLALQFHVVGA